jgi:hypothetical protein
MREPRANLFHLQQSFFKFGIDRCENAPRLPPSEFRKICDKLIHLLW